MARKKLVSASAAPAPIKLAARLITRLALAAIVLAVGGTAGAVSASTVSASTAVPLQLVYRVSQSVIGDLGFYTCVVEALGNGASEVRSQEHIAANMLGIPVYRMDATDTERWQGNRLVSFHAVTDKPNGRIEINGEARGNRFVVTSPQGTLTTTADVHPAEPCSASFLQSTTILRPDTGSLEQVRVSGGEPASVILGGVPVPVRKYVMDGKTRYTVWLDSRNLPVMFAIDDSAGQATFTLAKCVSCTPPVSRLGME